METAMKPEFVIAPHMRLQEWVAVEKGYFDDEELVYTLEDQLKSATNHVHDLGDKVGAYQTFEKGRSSDVSCACHWTVNVAAASGHGRLYGKAYSVSPCGIFVPADSDINHRKILQMCRFQSAFSPKSLFDHSGAGAVPVC